MGAIHDSTASRTGQTVTRESIERLVFVLALTVWLAVVLTFVLYYVQSIDRPTFLVARGWGLGLGILLLLVRTVMGRRPK
jgi:hypothetical protein